MAEEECRDAALVRRDGIRKVKDHLELNLMKISKRKCYVLQMRGGNSMSQDRLGPNHGKRG